MDREEAIAILNHKVSTCLHGTEWGEALDMAIKSLEQQPCEDAISRQAAIDAMYHHFCDKSREECAQILHEVPSVNPQANKEDIHREREQAYMRGYEDGSRKYRTDDVSTEKTDSYKQGWHDAIGKALDEAYDIVIDGERFGVVQEETLIGLGMAYEQPYVPEINVGKMGESEDAG